MEKTPLSRYTLDHQHSDVRAEFKAMMTEKKPPEADAISSFRRSMLDRLSAAGIDKFVIHSLRHTMLTRLGAAGVDAFTIMRIAGHCAVTVSQRYVHPTPETLERAFDQFEAAEVGAEREAAENGPYNRPYSSREDKQSGTLSH